VAKDDPNELYNIKMGNTSVGYFGANIQRSNFSPNYSYSVEEEWANRPVNFVTFWDAARFANWLHNGQPVGPQGPGTTEAGAYINVGNQATFAREPDARFYIPTEDEWYKAAYHDKHAGISDSYFDFPTGTNSVPGNSASESTNAGNNANYYYTSNYAIGSPYFRTEVGEFELSGSSYGTFDQAGNVWEWTESSAFDSMRSMRGGSFAGSDPELLRASFRDYYFPDIEFTNLGFRVASAVPEPNGLTLCAGIAMTLLLTRRKM
jgi:sulfatase modifying factor 1